MYYLRSKQKHLSMGGLDFVRRDSQKIEGQDKKDYNMSVKQYSMDI